MTLYGDSPRIPEKEAHPTRTNRIANPRTRDHPPIEPVAALHVAHPIELRR